MHPLRACQNVLMWWAGMRMGRVVHDLYGLSLAQPCFVLANTHRPLSDLVMSQIWLHKHLFHRSLRHMDKDSETRQKNVIPTSTYLTFWVLIADLFLISWLKHIFWDLKIRFSRAQYQVSDNTSSYLFVSRLSRINLGKMYCKYYKVFWGVR